MKKKIVGYGAGGHDGEIIDIIEDNNECKKCIKCSHIYHKNIINSKNVCLICNYS